MGLSVLFLAKNVADIRPNLAQYDDVYLINIMYCNCQNIDYFVLSLEHEHLASDLFNGPPDKLSFVKFITVQQVSFN